MIDEQLYSITPKLRKKLEALHEEIYRHISFEGFVENQVKTVKPFQDFHLHCKHGYEYGPYNPDNQAHYMRVYDRNDTLSKAEFLELTEFERFKYVLYIRWKNGEITENQLKSIKWFEIMATAAQKRG